MLENCTASLTIVDSMVLRSRYRVHRVEELGKRVRELRHRTDDLGHPDNESLRHFSDVDCRGEQFGGPGHRRGGGGRMVRGHHCGRPGVADLTRNSSSCATNGQTRSPMIEAEILIVANATAAGGRWIVEGMRYRGKSTNTASLTALCDISVMMSGNSLALVGSQRWRRDACGSNRGSKNHF